MTLRILAIDDSKTIRAMLSRCLTNAGLECEVAVDGVDGVAKYQSYRPDVVITDINMPELDGFGVIEALRSAPIHATEPILVLTTESAQDLRQRAQQAGATGWIVKPFDDTSLLSVLRRITGVVSLHG